ncbi:MAG: hypothetical protein NXI31_17980 [bacterium]|nr:hypothetical protein [bacterium]
MRFPLPCAPHRASILLASLALAVGLPAQSPITLPSFIDDSTFGPLLTGNVYVSSGSVTVPPNTTLTVQPGVVVKFSIGATFTVSGTLDVQGTSAQPTFFTSIRDASVGGSTSSQNPAPGDWRGAIFQSGSDASTVRSAVFRFGGRTNDATVSLNGADILLEGVTVAESSIDGIEVNTSFPTIRDTMLINNSGRSIDDVPLMALANFSNLTAMGNGVDALRATSNSVSANTALGPDNYPGDAFVVVSNINVNPGSTLTVAAGTVVKVAGAARATISGTILCNGTNAERVFFTSIGDDSVGGDSQNNGPTNGTPGDWAGLVFNALSDASVLTSTTVRFAGNNTPTGIDLNLADIRLDDVLVERTSGNGIELNASQPQIVNSRFENNTGRSIDNASLAALPGLSNNTATGNGIDAIRSTNNAINGDVSIGPDNYIGDALVLFTNASVTAGSSLTFDPGVIVKYAGAGRVNVSGDLFCSGTSQDPVVFTSIEDDSIGGDTQNDGPTTGNPGDWGGLVFQASADASVLERTTVRFAGNNLAAAINVNGADIHMDGVAIERSGSRALELDMLALPRVVNSRFDDNSGNAVGGLSWAQLGRFVDNTASGNLRNHITVDRALFEPVTVISTWNTLNGDGVLVPIVHTSLPANTSLQLGAGLILKFAGAPTASGFTVSNSSASLLFNGRGYSKIVLTSILDDDHGGDTNGDGNATAPGPGAWGSVRYNSGGARMDHVLCRFGGGTNGATVVLRSAGTSMDAVRVELSSTDGFNIGQNGGGLRNLVAFGNSGDGLVIDDSISGILHATVAANVGRGIVTEGSHTGGVGASISWFNGINANDNYVGFVDQLGQPVRIFFSNGSPMHDGSQANIMADPLFRDPTNGDLNLSLFSPCVGRGGVPNGSFTYEDHDGRSRVLDHNLFGFALPDMGAHEYAVYEATIDGVPRLGTSVSFLIEGQPFQGNPPGAGILFFGGPYLGIGVFRPPYGNANIEQPGFPFFNVLWGFNGTPLTVSFPNDSSFVGLPLGLQVLSVQLSNVGTGNWTQAFYGTLSH